jgi:hypothetical protein
MLATLIVLAGIAFVVGGNVAKDFAGKALKAVLGVCLFLVLPCLVQSCVCLLREASATETSSSGGLLVFLLLAALVGVGVASWKLRAWRARRDLALRRHEAPRTRALPPPRPTDGGQS